MKREGIIVLFLIIVLSFAVYAFFDYEWKEGRNIFNPACNDSLLKTRYKSGSGVYFSSISHSFDDATGTYYFNASLRNIHPTSKNIEYEWFACRCKEHGGNAWDNGPICLGYWPFINYSGSGNYPENCLGLGEQNIFLAPYQQKNISVSYNQFRNQSCGMLQVDLHLHSINNYTVYAGLMAAGIVNLCENCEEPYCGDGILDLGEECDDGNLINGDGCDANCTIEYNDFCEQFYCGFNCFYADWKNNEPSVKYPNDCTVVIVAREGKYYPKCVPTTCAD